MSSEENKPKRQRALVLQGGGAVGAYEVGVLKFLRNSKRKIRKKVKKIDCYLISSQVHP
jgi:predicted acylesterase/phospholipase RssA